MANSTHSDGLNGRLVELLSARLCHDLISPVSAINNGIELIAEMGEDPGGEAMALIGSSAKDVARKLQFFRLAFGSARLPNGTPASLGEARAALADFPTGERISINWPVAPAGAAPREGTKLVLLLVLVALDCLGGSGQVGVATALGPGGLRIDVTAAGPRAALGGDMAAALGEAGGGAAELSPKTAPAAYAAALARAAGGQMTAAAGAGEVRLSCQVPATVS